MLGPDESDLYYLNGASYTSVGEFQETFFTKSKKCMEGETDRVNRGKSKNPEF
jgi:hypothetical protein